MFDGSEEVFRLLSSVEVEIIKVGSDAKPLSNYRSDGFLSSLI